MLVWPNSPIVVVSKGVFCLFNVVSRVLVFVFPPGSAWAEYKKTRTVHGIPLPEGLQESQKLPTPLFTPSTKAEQGAHDENISPEQGDIPTPLPPTTYDSPLNPNARYEQLRRSSAKNYTTEFPI